jgi:hypothetical protein
VAEEPKSASPDAEPAPGGDSAPGGEPGDATPEGTPPAPRRSWRRRLALPVILVGVAVMVAYWSRTKPVEVTVIYDLGQHAARASRLTASFARDGDGRYPVEWTFPPGSTPQRRYRHKLTLKPGTYVVRARLHLRAEGNRPAAVHKLSRKVDVAAGQSQRLTLRFR